jgi:DNA anti-recombination protein RmuC
MRLSVPYLLRGYLFTVACALLLFSVPPVHGQTAAPNTNTAVETIAETAQNLGALGFAVVTLGIALVLLMAAVLLFFWKFAQPFLNAIVAANKSRDEANAAEREAREEQQEASSTHLKIFDQRERETQELRTRQTEALERIVDKLNDNDERSEEGRKGAVKAITQHVDEKFDELRRDIEPMDKKLDSILTRLTPDEKPTEPHPAVTPAAQQDALDTPATPPEP